MLEEDVDDFLDGDEDLDMVTLLLAEMDESNKQKHAVYQVRRRFHMRSHLFMCIVNAMEENTTTSTTKNEIEPVYLGLVFCRRSQWQRGNGLHGFI